MEGSRKLHNFSFPTGLMWGKQQLLRCMKGDPVRPMLLVEDEKFSDSDEANENPSTRQIGSTDDRQKKLNFGLDSSSSPINASSSPNEGEENAPPLKFNSSKNLTSKASSLSPPPAICSKDVAGRGINVEADGRRSSMKTRPRRKIEKKEERLKFSIQLSHKEIEEDFIAMTGKKPPRKPTKRPRSLQKKLDALSPGLHLSEVHQDGYKVNENGKI